MYFIWEPNSWFLKICIHFTQKTSCKSKYLFACLLLLYSKTIKLSLSVFLHTWRLEEFHGSSRLSSRGPIHRKTRCYRIKFSPKWQMWDSRPANLPRFDGGRGRGWKGGGWLRKRRRRKRSRVGGKTGNRSCDSVAADLPSATGVHSSH